MEIRVSGKEIATSSPIQQKLCMCYFLILQVERPTSGFGRMLDLIGSVDRHLRKKKCQALLFQEGVR